jgi:hypothetical protein
VTIKKRRTRRNTEWWAKERRDRRMKWRRNPGKSRRKIE